MPGPEVEVGGEVEGGGGEVEMVEVQQGGVEEVEAQQPDVEEVEVQQPDVEEEEVQQGEEEVEVEAQQGEVEVELQQGGGALAQDLFDYAGDAPGQGDELGGHLTSGCLRQWREGRHSTLSDMLTPVTLQITHFTLMNGKSTGQVVVSDGTHQLPAMLGHPGAPRSTFIELHNNRRFHLFSLVTVQQTSGPPENLTIVRFQPNFIIINKQVFIHPFIYLLI